MKHKHHDRDLGFVAEALPAFISEAHEQTQALEQLLLQLEEHPHDRELLDALFRCAHTIKGSAGIFGLSPVVEFTHHVETLLDRLREGRLSLDLDLSTLLLQCNDQIGLLIDQSGQSAADGADPAELSGQIERRADLVMQIHALLGQDDDMGAQTSGAPATAASAASDRPGRWHLSTRYGPDTFRNGMDPMALLTYLESLGEVVAISCDRAAIPPLDTLDPETCYLAFELGLETSSDRETIESAFSFVRDDCTLRLVAPGADPGEFVRLIEAMPDHLRLGDMLVSVGAVTQAQIDACLRTQDQVRAATHADPTHDDVPRIGELLQAREGLAPQVVSAALKKQQRQREASAADDGRYIRVKADRLDAVINLLGELVIAGAGASMLARQTRQGELIEANQHVTRLVEEIRNGTLQLRMVPIAETFNRFRRVVRDTATALGKAVDFEIEGGETELDKSMVERIADPLMHLVRNGLDHGLETPAERQAAGKPATGRLVLSARHESGSIVIRIDDDGRGIDRQRVLQRAWERGLVEPGVVPADGDILKLIFEPGFSTAAQVTELSGRGVGMDVVRSNIEALRGSVGVHSVPGQGTQIDIRLPLTLAIIDGFLVGVAASKFILPLDTVVEVISSDQASSVPDSHGRFCVELRGEVLPVVDLRTLYELQGDNPELTSIVVVRGDAAPYGLVVDTLLGQHQTVIKPLGPLFRRLRGISGSSILGNGEVALNVDVNSLCQLAEQPPPTAPPSAAASAASVATATLSSLTLRNSARLQPSTQGQPS